MPRKHDPALHLKIRVIPQRRMTQTEGLALVERAIATGVVPPGIRIEYIDWRKGQNSDRLDEPTLRDLRAWYGAVLSAGMRVGKVRKTDRGDG